MKKKLAAFLVLATAAALVSCGKNKYELALVTDVGTINDKSFNQGAWEGVEKYAQEFSLSYKYYQPDSQSTDDYIKSAEVAIENGAKVVVTPGYLFENAIWVLQSKHPNVKFIILDGGAHNVTDWDTNATVDGSAPDFTIKDNVYSIMYAEEQSGFLAGYAAVKEGFTKLGFMGGMSVPAVVRFGLGYIDGAQYAAVEDNLDDKAITIKYEYLNSFGPDAAHKAKAESWYEAGTNVIFAAAGGAGNSVMKAAEDKEKWVIGVDVDQKAESTRVLTSAMKQLKNSVYQTLGKIYAGEKGGEQITLDAKVDGVGLPNDFSRFTKFTATMYNAIYAKLQSGSLAINKDVETDLTKVSLSKVTVDYVA